MKLPSIQIYIYTYEFIQILIPTVSYITRLVRWFLGIIYIYVEQNMLPTDPTHYIPLPSSDPFRKGTRQAMQ